MRENDEQALVSYLPPSSGRGPTSARTGAARQKGHKRGRVLGN
jgi:hypothetical protein